MKKLTFLMMATVGAGAFFLQAKPKTEKNNQPDETEISTVNEHAATMLGTYAGQFGDTKMTLSLDRLVGKTVTGYSIVQGNERAFSGSWSTESGSITIVAKEPGDHKEDGVYHLTFKLVGVPSGDILQMLEGTWSANDKKIASVDLSLTKKPFKYSAKVGDYPQSSTKVLKEKDVENMKPEELRLMRNEIYARHGYCFHLADMRQHFSKQEWYMPVAVDVKTSLTDTEKKNEVLIKRYENYSEKYYDSFGR